MSLPVPGANRSIEISSPRLLCGRAAVYRSTMVPLMPHRVIQVPPVYQCSLFCSLRRRIAATHQRDVLGLTMRFSSYLKMPFISIKAQENTHFSWISKKFFSWQLLLSWIFDLLISACLLGKTTNKKVPIRTGVRTDTLKYLIQWSSGIWPWNYLSKL